MVGQTLGETTMTILIAGLALFFGIHSVRIVAGGFRDAQIAANPGRWKGLYSLVSAAGVGLILWGWMQYRPAAPVLYDPPAWGRHLAMTLILPAFILLIASQGPSGRIRATVRNPMLIAVVLWAFAHLMANGDLASVILFGAFLAYAAVDLVSVSLRGDPAPPRGAVVSDVIAVVFGSGLYVLFLLFAHRWMFGVSPLG